MYHNAGWGHFSTKTAEDVRNEIAPSSKKGGISSDSCEDTEGETYMLSDQVIEMLEKTCDVPSELMKRLVKARHTDRTCKEKYMNIVYAFIIIDLICVSCLDTYRSIIVNILYTGV